VKPIAIDNMKVMNLGLGRSIYSPAQLEKFARFQESQGTRRAFLAESAERAYNGRVAGEWGSGLTDLATDSLIDTKGYHLVPMYQVIDPTAVMALLIVFLVGILRMMLDIVIWGIAIARVRGCRWWLMGAFWGTLCLVAVALVQWGDGQRAYHQQDSHVGTRWLPRQYASRWRRLRLKG
jgi:TM2 domain-containing membrane protein YozV